MVLLHILFLFFRFSINNINNVLHIHEVNHDPLIISHQTRSVFADRNRATSDLINQQDIDFSIGVICSCFHEMYVLSGMTGCEKVDSEYLNP